MKKSGGIIALIGGVFGTIAAIATLFIGGVGAALEGRWRYYSCYDGMDRRFGSVFINHYWWCGYGVKRQSTRNIIDYLCSFRRNIWCTIVAICMILTLAGGIMALFGNKNTPIPNEI